MLAGELAKLQRGEHPRLAVEAYEAAFRPFVVQTQEIPGIVPGVAHPDTAWKRWLLQTALSTLSRAADQPWLVKLVGGNKSTEQNDDGFVLPQYETLERAL